jgi:hypothetical protein
MLISKSVRNEKPDFFSVQIIYYFQIFAKLINVVIYTNEKQLYLSPSKQNNYINRGHVNELEICS